MRQREPALVSRLQQLLEEARKPGFDRPGRFVRALEDQPLEPVERGMRRDLWLALDGGK
jgi:hypothetical protein